MDKYLNKWNQIEDLKTIDQDPLMSKESLYEKVRQESVKRGLDFQSIPQEVGVEYGFVISSQIGKTYGNVLSSEMQGGEIYQGITENLYKYYKSSDGKSFVIIVDSIISLHRAEFTGRETLAERQKRLNIMLNKLVRLAEVHNIAVVVTNQVQSQPDNFFADVGGLSKVTGGNILGHASTYRILLRKAGKHRLDSR